LLRTEQLQETKQHSTNLASGIGGSTKKLDFLCVPGEEPPALAARNFCDMLDIR